MTTFQLIEADCIEAMASMDEASVDAIVTDPPYGLEFMGKEWDSFKTGRAAKYASMGEVVPVSMPGTGFSQLPTNGRPAKRCANCGKQSWSGSPCKCETPRWVLDNSPLHAFQDWCEAWATQALRVLKPGGHLLAFGGTRTFHRLACALEDAGFEIRDTLCWLYGSGFPKSLDVSKAIDKRAEVNVEIQERIALVARVIRLHREAKGMERAEVSEAVVGTPSGACWNWEHQQLPSIEMWPAIKATLDISDTFDGLIEGDRAQFIAAEREVVGVLRKNQPGGTSAFAEGGIGSYVRGDMRERPVLGGPATPEAERWQGWGSSLKPAFEPVVLARKPLIGTIAANVLEHGTGALNIDGTRIGTEVETWPSSRSPMMRRIAGKDTGETEATGPMPSGRWPANVILGHSPDCKPTGKTRKVKASDPRRADGTVNASWGTNGILGGADSPGMDKPRYADEDGTENIEVWDCYPDCPVRLLDEQSGERGGASGVRHNGAFASVAKGAETPRDAFGYADSGGASRFFYVPKADREERNRGLGHREEFPAPNAVGDPDNPTRTRGSLSKARANVHPTVKPVELMQWLVRLITPPKGTILDPFTGSGSTGIAALREGFTFIGIEREPEYVEIARDRILGDAPLFNQEAR